MRLTSIFFDLDETLIHSVLAEGSAGKCPADATVFGPYHSWLRPCALDLLKAARSTGVATFLCTNGVQGNLISSVLGGVSCWFPLAR
jgi:hypothetical protein